MALVDRRKISLYEEAKAGFSSLIKQTVAVFVGLLLMLLLTGGNPPGWVVALSFFGGIGFVAWSENKRLTELEAGKSSDSPETFVDSEQHTATSEASTTEKVPQRDVNLIIAEKSSTKDNNRKKRAVSRRIQHRRAVLDQIQQLLMSKDISRNKVIVLQRRFALFSLNSQSLQKLQNLLQQVVEAKTDNFLELAKIAGLNPAKDFVGANLSDANLSRTNLRDANLSDANLSGANLSHADLSSANLSDANLSGSNLSHANLSCAHLSVVNLSGANLSHADLSSAFLGLANLSDTNLSGAEVRNATFGHNQGLSEDIKLDLKRRGAIFEDSPGDRSIVPTPH